MELVLIYFNYLMYEFDDMSPSKFTCSQLKTQFELYLEAKNGLKNRVRHPRLLKLNEC